MSETQTSQSHPDVLSHEQAIQYEPLTEERLGDIMAALGNHEAKAVMYIGMQPDTLYAAHSLQTMMRNIQGGEEGYAPRRTVFKAYCKDSLEPVGLLAKVVPENGNTYYEKETSVHATALAGALLEFTATNPDISLEGIFGGMSFPGKKGESGVQRAPSNRLRMLEALISTPEYPMTLRAINRIVDMPYSTIKHNLDELDKGGIIEYDTKDSRQNTDATIQITGDLSQARPVEGQVGLTKVVVEALATSDGQVEYGFFLNLVKTDLKYAQQQKINSNIGAALRGLERQGIINRDGFAKRDEMSLIMLDEAVREKLAILVGRIRLIAAGNGPEIERWNSWAKDLVTDPVRVRELIAKGYGASRKVNALSYGEKITIINEALEGNAVQSTSEVLARFGKRAGRLTVRKALEDYYQQGGIQRIFDDDTGSWYWSRSAEEK